jgi:hypothetical protein
LREHSCALANYGFATIFTALNLLDYGTWGILKAIDNATAHQKNAALKRTVWQLQAATVRQCCSESANARLHLEKAIAIGRGIAMISQATVLACNLKPFAGL